MNTAVSPLIREKFVQELTHVLQVDSLECIP